MLQSCMIDGVGKEILMRSSTYVPPRQYVCMRFYPDRFEALRLKFHFRFVYNLSEAHLDLPVCGDYVLDLLEAFDQTVLAANSDSQIAVLRMLEQAGFIALREFNSVAIHALCENLWMQLNERFKQEVKGTLLIACGEVGIEANGIRYNFQLADSTALRQVAPQPPQPAQKPRVKVPVPPVVTDDVPQETL